MIGTVENLACLLSEQDSLLPLAEIQGLMVLYYD